MTPDEKVTGKNKKLAALIIPTVNEDKAVEYNAGKVPVYFSQVQFLVKREKAEQIKKVFAYVIKNAGKFNNSIKSKSRSLM